MSHRDFSWPGRRTGDLAHDLVAAYLVLDIQRSPLETDELLEKIKAVKAGMMSGWERVGNAYVLVLMPNQASIESDFSEESAVVALEEFEQAAMAWRQFIDQTFGKEQG